VLLYNFRARLIEVFQKVLPVKDAALVAGVTLGSKSSIPSDFWDSLKSSGTAHVVVASGMNVTLIAKFLISVLAIFFTRRKALVLAIGGIWLYVLIVGLDAPIVRAAIMGTLVFTAQEYGRVNYAWRALLFSAAIMLLVKPGWIADAGFQLSFSATASLIVFEKRVRKHLQFIPNILREDLSTSLAAQVGVAPILYLTFGQLNLLSPIINATVLWTIVPITVVGIAGGVLSLIFVPLGKIVLWTILPLTQWFIWIVSNFNSNIMI
jgi:competence protein ComEC